MSDHYSNFSDLEAIITRLRDEENRWDAILDLKLSDNYLWVPSFIGLLNDPDWVIRWCIAEKLGDMKDLRAVTPLILSLNDEDGHVVKNAYHALKKFGHEIVPNLLPFYSHKNKNIREKIHELIIGFGEPIVPTLRKELDTHQWVVGNRIVHTIWEIGKSKEENTLITCLSHRHAQKTVIILLGSLKSISAIPHFIRMYQKPNLRRVIFYAIRLIGKDSAFPVIIHALNNSALSVSAEMMIIKVGPSMLPFLVKELAKGVVNRQIIVTLITRIGPDSVRGELIALAEKNKDIAAVTKEIRRNMQTKSDVSKKNFGLF